MSCPLSDSDNEVTMEHEKRLRREIANSNERRRMQSINAGFQSLRNLLPHHEGEKLSKAAILQQTSDFIYQIEQEKSKALSEISRLKRTLANAQSGEHSSSYVAPHSPAMDIPPSVAKRRKTLDGAVESADEGIGSMSPDHSGSGEDCRSELAEHKRELAELRMQLDHERRQRLGLEDHVTVLQQQNNSLSRRLQFKEESDRVPVPGQPGRVIQDETARCVTYRNNLETIVEAIRHLEGDHLFSDDHPINKSPSTVESPRAMELGSPSNSPSHTVSQTDTPTGTNVASSVATVTSLKHHVLNRIARTSDSEEPINLEFRPGMSPVHTVVVTPAGSAMNFVDTKPIIAFAPNSLQQRPGVIVVKHA